MDVVVCVPTYGESDWVRLAHQRAIPSAEPQARVIHRHGPTLAQARNEALALAESEWIVFLDADDELAPGYIDAMDDASGDLRCPAVSFVLPGYETPPRFVATCDLSDGNHLTIGTAVRRELALEVGGFREWPILEDLCFWQRCWKTGARVERVPDAVYRAVKRRGSRSRSRVARLELERTFDAIRRANFPELYLGAAA